MSDRILIPIAGLGVLALSREAYAEALAAGAELSAAAAPSAAASTEPLVDAVELAAALHVPVTWVEQAAREQRIPSIQAGRWRRFDRAAVLRALKANGKPA